MAGWKLFNRKDKTAERKIPAASAAAQTDVAESPAPSLCYCSFCGQKYPSGTKHYCSVSDLIKYDLK